MIYFHDRRIPRILSLTTEDTFLCPNNSPVGNRGAVTSKQIYSDPTTWAYFTFCASFHGFDLPQIFCCLRWWRESSNGGKIDVWGPQPWKGIGMDLEFNFHTSSLQTFAQISSTAANRTYKSRSKFATCTMPSNGHTFPPQCAGKPAQNKLRNRLMS
ncbi:hypothetical protein CEXT_510261 [Caerostris extrusa]|uniref:Uncharacterized protein n=1 Tax=Caerostris extrusa TaxID=172846 RepID=A0AAV4QU08_CAEEX|nr:hypothetical protein CEXT_510261 [Caerostris extrusa]